MKGLWAGLMLLVTALPASAPGWEDVQRQILNFYVHFDVFSRKAFGCPAKGEFVAADCHKANEIIDYKEFEAAKREAMKLFGLHDDNE